MDGKAEPFFWLEEYSGKPLTPVSSKRKARSKKLEFIGWGSKPLIEFLESIGKDTTKQISQHDVADIIGKYANDNNLLHPAKKKRILCDERLYSIFGRKAISRIKVHDLLETHYADNQDAWDDDLFVSSEEENVGEEQKGLSLERKNYQKKKVFETPKSCFAAIVPDNIKLVYLKKSLVVDLLKDFESFEAKVVDSFVRIKTDPNKFLQKNSHELVLVRGLKKVCGNNDINKDILLQVSNFVKDVSISMLSDDNFSQEECEDLHQRIKKGLLKRPTVVELEAKARILHADITKNWLAAELTLLSKLIDRANEKGWRRESLTMFEYMERRELLQTPDEQSRLLCEVPNVMAEEVELETASQDVKHENDSTQISTVGGTSEIPSDPASNGKLSALMPPTTTIRGTSEIPSDPPSTGKLSTLMPPTTNVRETTEIPNGPASIGKLSTLMPSTTTVRGTSEIPSVQASIGKLSSLMPSTTTVRGTSEIPSERASIFVRGTSELPSDPASVGKLSTLMPLTKTVRETSEIACSPASIGKFSTLMPSTTTVRGASEIPSDPASIGKFSTLMHLTTTVRGTSEIPSYPASIGKFSTLIPLTTTVRGISEIPSDPASTGQLSTFMPLTTVSAAKSACIFSEDNTVRWHDVREQLIRPRDSNVESAQLMTVREENRSINNQNFVKISNTTTQVIDLSDDEEYEDSNEDVKAYEDVRSLMWHYVDPQGDIQGPFSLESLKIWMDADYFPNDFKVWKTGQNRDKAVLLADIICRNFPI